MTTIQLVAVEDTMLLQAFFFINFSQQGGAHAHPCPFGAYMKICHHNIICKYRWMTFSPLKVEEPLYGPQLKTISPYNATVVITI